MSFFYNTRFSSRDEDNIEPAGPCTFDASSLDKEGSFLLKTIESVLYLIVFIETFRHQIGLGATGGIVGGALTLLGLFTFFVCISNKEIIPPSLFFIVGINVAATISQTLGNGEYPFIGEGLPELLHLFSFTVILCYLARNRQAEVRMVVFFSLVVALAVYSGGVEYLHYKRARLTLEGVGGGYANANDLAYVSGLLACSLLFLSLLLPKKVRPVMWVLSFILIFDCTRTLSRGGILALATGLGIFVLTVFRGRQKIFNVMLLLALAASLTTLVFVQKHDYIGFISDRFVERSYYTRLDVYRTDLIGDLAETAMVGKGRRHAITSSGISAHNTFIAIHIAYGGLAAYIYLAWMLYLLASVVKFAMDKSQRPEYRLLTVTILFMMYVSHLFSNNGYIFISSIFANALIEKYTYMHRPRLMRAVLHRNIYE